MFEPLQAINKYVIWIVIIVVLGLGWFLYQFVVLEHVASQNAPPPRPEIISREEWNARPLNLEAIEEFGAFDPLSNPAGVLRYSDDLADVLNTIVVHHSAYSYAGPTEIQDLHMDIRGFADIAYHYLIDQDGLIFEGRELSVRGAHVQGFNTGTVGIVLLGNFNEEDPSTSQISSLRILVDYMRYSYDINYLAGHRDYPDQSPDGTECPGNNLYPHLRNIADEFGMEFGIQGYIQPEWVN